jgi:O-antigen ligase
MSSIETPRRTDAGTARVDLGLLATGIATAILAILMISFQPFQPSGPAETGGNIVNQLGFGTLGAVSIASLAIFAPPRVVLGLYAPSFLLLIGFMFLAVLNATDPFSALRAASFTVIGILAVSTVLAIPRDADAFCTVLSTASILVLAVCYAGLVLFPGEAKHTADSFEPQHAGLWRGVFAHKNIAGPVMACLAFGALYIFRRGRVATGALIFAASMLFMLKTGSKTTVGLVPVAMAVVALPAVYGMRPLAAFLFVAAIVGTALATLGIVFIEPLRHLAATHFPDLTYTGRTTLWEFAGEMIAKKPLTGYGYESFWMTPFMLSIEQPFDRAWDIRAIVHGHNGYVDIALLMGVPALIVAVWAFLIAPVIDFLRVPMRRENVLIADLFMMILLFTTLNAFLESFFFRRADPVWLFLVFAVLGLRLAARFPVAGRRDG